MLLRTMLRKALRVAHHAGFRNLDFLLAFRFLLITIAVFVGLKLQSSGVIIQVNLSM
jgi:hypothetical protein